MSRASIIVATFNGARKIPVLLNSLLVHDDSRAEVVVVVDGSSDDTMEVLGSFDGRFNSLIVLKQENRGRASARNAGFRQSSGDVIIFFDDDVEVTRGSIQRHVAFHARESSAVYSGNPVDLYNPEAADIQNYKSFISKKWFTRFNTGLNEVNVENMFFSAANCSFRREVFIKLNGFDERLRDAEDLDLAWRALESGMPVYFDKDNIVIHHDMITCSGYIRRQRQYLLAKDKLLSMYPERTQLRGKKVNWQKRIFYSTFRFRWWEKVVDNNLISFLPQSIRYRIYSWIIHSRGILFTKSQ